MSLFELRVGHPFPGYVPDFETATANFLRTGGSTLYLFLSNLSKGEIAALKKGPVRGGMKREGPAIQFYWQFGTPANPVLTFETPFDIRKVPDLSLPNIENANQRLTVRIMAVDIDTRLLKALRLVTLPSGLTRDFLSAAQDQMALSESADPILDRWAQSPPEKAIGRITMHTLGT